MRDESGHARPPTDGYPEGKARKRLNDFSAFRSLVVEESAPKRPNVDSDTLLYAAGIASTGAKVAGVALPEPSNPDGRDALDASVKVATAMRPSDAHSSPRSAG